MRAAFCVIDQTSDLPAILFYDHSVVLSAQAGLSQPDDWHTMYIEQSQFIVGARHASPLHAIQFRRMVADPPNLKSRYNPLGNAPIFRKEFED